MGIVLILPLVLIFALASKGVVAYSLRDREFTVRNVLKCGVLQWLVLMGLVLLTELGVTFLIATRMEAPGPQGEWYLFAGFTTLFVGMGLTAGLVITTVFTTLMTLIKLVGYVLFKPKDPEFSYREAQRTTSVIAGFFFFVYLTIAAGMMGGDSTANRSSGADNGGAFELLMERAEKPKK